MPLQNRLPVSYKVCSVGLTPSSFNLFVLKFYLRVAHEGYAPLDWHHPDFYSVFNPGVAHARYASLDCSSKFCLWILHRKYALFTAMLDWRLPHASSASLPSACTVGLAPSSSKFCFRVACKKHAPLDCRLPPVTFALGWLQKVCAVGLASSFKVYLRVKLFSVGSWNGTFFTNLPSDG